MVVENEIIFIYFLLNICRNGTNAACSNIYIANRDTQMFICENIGFNNLIVALCIIVVALLLSHLYIYCVKNIIKTLKAS